MKKVLFVASECVPFIKTGGLADVVGSLPKCFNKEEFDVRVILPKYMCMKEEYKSQMNYVSHFYLSPMGIFMKILRNLLFFPRLRSLRYR